MNVLFLDDNALRCPQFRSAVPCATIVNTSKECIEALEAATEPWDIVFLDHDLGGEVYCDSWREDTGAEVARWMAAHKPAVGVVVLHTFNDCGKRNMVFPLVQAGYTVEYIPFGKDTLERVSDLEVVT